MVHIVMVHTKVPGCGVSTVVDSIWDTKEKAEAQISFYQKCDMESGCEVDTYSIFSKEVFTEEPDQI